MRRIAIVTPESSGGARYSVEKLVKGLRREGFLIEQFPFTVVYLCRQLMT